MCQKGTVICKEQVKDENLSGLGESQESTQFEYAETDVEAFR